MTTPREAVLTSVSPVFREPGPLATVYLDVSRDTEGGAHEVGLRWEGFRKQLTADGADQATLDAVEQAVLDRRPPGRAGQVVVAGRGRVVLDELLPAPPRRETAHWGPLPHLLPYVAQRPAHPSYVLAVADRTGAEVLGYEPGHADGAPPALELAVEGTDLEYVHKPRGGGMAHKRFQNTAEVTWERNARSVAGTVERLTDALDAQLVLIAGDVRARQLVREALHGRARELAVDVEAGGMRPGASFEHLRRAVDQRVGEVEAEADAAVVAELAEELGQRDRAVEGLAPTVEALRKAQVATLVVVDDPSADGTLWVGPEPTHVGVTPDELTSVGVGRPVAERADAALLRAAVGTGAGVLVAADGQVDVRDGVGAVLRYADR